MRWPVATIDLHFGMRDWILPLAIVCATIAAMEVVAFALHKYVMHGPGWGWHRSHHQPSGRLEKNDLYAVGFGALSLLLLTVLADIWAPAFWVGIGTTVYGVLYAVVHDGLVHRRFPCVRVPRRGYLKRLVQAHRLHHAVRDRDGAVSFGFLYARPVRDLKHRLGATQEAR